MASPEKSTFTPCTIKHAKVVELPSVEVDDDDDDDDDVVADDRSSSSSKKVIRIFELSLGSTTVQLCSLGASITKFMVGDNNDDNNDNDDDIVLGYQNVETMYGTKNSKYFGCVVGRVANRIENGQFTLGGVEYQNLAINNPPNHLHGGNEGFNNRIWDAEIITTTTAAEEKDEEEEEGSNKSNDCGYSAIRFTLISDDGDEGYPGKIQVSATYSLRDSISGSNGVVLRLELQAQLLEGRHSPINLAQHSYWNLKKHDDRRGVLDHHLSLKSTIYTPVDPKTSIPTREVTQLDDDPTMDWSRICTGPRYQNNPNRRLEDALRQYGTEKHSISFDQVKEDLINRQTLKDPYGFDHNYVVENQPGVALPKVGTLSCGRRTLTVYANSPGVQLYTANYLSSEEDVPPVCKGQYGPWSGICLETQHYPNSIDSKLDDSTEFGKGRCCILTPEKPNYEHVVEYHLEWNQKDDGDESNAKNIHIGKDTGGQKYSSIESMWAAQNLNTWYSQAKDYYEDHCSATVDGVLGGIGEISETDLQGSRNFLQSLGLSASTKSVDSSTKTIACEHGAGIGRVTKGLLLEFCDQSDLVESNSRLLYAAPDYIGVKASKCRFYNTELQDWQGKPNTYTIIWIQWVACYLRDDDLVEFLKRCAGSLVEDGVIVLKENTCVDDTFVVDVDDASLTRSHSYWLDLIYKTGILDVVKIEWQQDLPDDIFPVPMIALKRRKNN